VELTPKGVDSERTPVLVPDDESCLTGLALSGGGIRSAAFCLGALQALEEARVLQRVDYLSTVSGGGYIGCSTSAGMEAERGEFPFKIGKFEDETPAMQHVRDHSNYLFPHGVVDVFRNLSIYLRGLVANFLLLMPVVLLPAAATIYWIRNPEHLQRMEPFFVTEYLILGLLAIVAGWGIVRSRGKLRSVVEASGTWTKWFGAFVAFVMLFAVIELQPAALKALSSGPAAIDVQSACRREQYRTSEFCKQFESGTLDLAQICRGQTIPIPEVAARCPQNRGFMEALFKWVSSQINMIVMVLAPIAAVIGFLGSKLAEFLKSSKESYNLTTQVVGYAAKAAVYLAAIAVPLVLWAIYLNLSYWGICLNEPSAAKSACAPDWLSSVRDWVRATCLPLEWGIFVKQPVANVYLVAGLLGLVLTLFLRPNANSLHPLYRDRLGQAFLFNPNKVQKADRQSPLLHKPLKWLTGEHGPYHLINAALNIQKSRAANKRGRNADFFLFSPRYVGSEATDYVRTKRLMTIEKGLDLATVLAISGAAASSNMGSQSIKPLAPTLAILNVRLGYWLRNPKWFREPRTIVRRKRRYLLRPLLDWLDRRNILANFYIAAEILGQLDENRKSVYLTDGGHIENLGIYELLKRRCRVIIAVDAEADPEMAFGSFNTLVRYARIDLGIEIELPWAQITDVSRKTGKTIDEKGDTKKLHGPHCAIGRIWYPTYEQATETDNGPMTYRTGVLIYIKSSLTGDENDYVFHYKRRYSRFPHETTIDQMFSEEQFEAYRALGYHATNGFFDRRDDFAKLDVEEFEDARKDAAFLDSLFPRQGGSAMPARPNFADRFPRPGRTPNRRRRPQTGGPTATA
jgi:predicted acylesterase/phospholipase RssA